MLGTGAGVLNRDYTDTTAEIKLYQTQNWTDYLNSNDLSENYLFLIAESVLEDTLERDFPNLSYTLEYGSKDIPSDMMNPQEKKPDKLSRSGPLAKWISYNREEQAENANILIGMKNYDSKPSSHGISNSAVMPKSISPIDGFSTIWHDPEANRFPFKDIILHEVGHCLGLRHYHGGNVDYANLEDVRSVMLSRSFSKKSKKNFFGNEVTFTEERARKFNDNLSVEHLNL